MLPQVLPQILDVSHNGWLVLASLAIALMAGFSGLSITRGASKLHPAHRKLNVVIAAIVLGGGIWSMHFVAMLGLQLPIRYYYDGLMTLVSALIAILMVGLALLILHFLPRTRITLTTAGSIVGLGITAMHYVGMLGMELCQPLFAPLGLAVAFVCAIGLSNLAIWVAYGARTKGNILLGTVCFALSVGAVHYIAMAGTGFSVGNTNAVGPEISNEIMAMGVTVSAFVISGTFLLTGVSFIDPPSIDPPGIDRPGGDSLSVTASSADLPAQATAQPVAQPVAQPTPQPAFQPGQPVPDATTILPVPFEKEGRTRFLDRTAISAVRAEGHYTLLYSGKDKLFCPWSISEAEQRLSSSRFIRAHRSYLINPAYVTGFERTKDTGICFFDTTGSLPKVPVSRSRLHAVRDALGL